MKIGISARALTMGILGLLGLLVGCTPNHVNLVADGTVTLSVEPTHPFRADRVRVYKEGGELVIAGRVITSTLGSTHARTEHVDVDILSVDGKVLNRFQALVKPKILSRRSRLKKRWPRFTVRTRANLPTNGAIAIRWHKGDH